MMLCWVINRKEEHIIDREGDVFDPLLFVNDLSTLKVKILKESRVGEDEFRLHESGLVKWCLPQVYHHLEFVSWCAQYYSEFRREIRLNDESTVSCQINLESIREIFNVSSPEGHEHGLLNEESLSMTFNQLSTESKYEDLMKFMKFD